MSSFKIVTWNVENLFQPKDASALDRYNEKLKLLARVIKQQRPDVVALQEIGDEESFVDLQNVLHDQGSEYSYSVISNHPDVRGIRVAFLSQLPLGKPTDIFELPKGPATEISEYDGYGRVVPVTRLSRGALKVTVKKDEVFLTLITLHLKSKLLSFRRPHGSVFNTNNENERAQVAGIAIAKRSAEAITIRQIVNDLFEKNSSTPLIVLGDFNDVPEAQTSLILCGPPGSEIGT